MLTKLSHISLVNKFRDKVKEQKEILNNLVNREDEEGIEQYFLERAKFNELLLQEEVYWKQRAKVFWLQEGDSNSKFFHAQASQRKRLNKITHLLKEDGTRVDIQEDMNVLTKDYFTKVFTDSEVGGEYENNAGHHVLTDGQNAELIADLSFEEFTLAVK